MKIILFALLFPFVVHAKDIHEPDVPRLTVISLHHVATMRVMAGFGIPGEDIDPKVKKVLRDYAISSLPLWFEIYLLTDGFKTHTDAYPKQLSTEIKRFLNDLTKKEIKSAFALYFDPKAPEHTTFSWPLKGYTLEKFHEDFPDFQKLAGKD